MPTITEFPIAATEIADLPTTKGPQLTGKVTYNVATLVTGGSGTLVSPWTGWDTAIAALFGPNKTFYFPSGVYGYSTSPNFGVHGNVHYKGEHGTVLKYTGSGRAVELFATQPAQQTGVNTVFGIIFENFIIDGSGTGTVGLYLNSIHHSIFRNVFVRNVTDKGFHFRFTILNTYDTLHATTRVGDTDGLGESTPLAIGFYLDNDGNVVNAVQACTFINCIAEECTGVGIHLQGANQNQFLGGSSEQNDGKNLVCYGHGNTFYGMDNEYSGDADAEDFYIGGNYNKVVNCLGNGTIRIGNDVDGGDYIGNEIIGGQFNKIIVDVHAQFTRLDKPAYNFSSTGGYYNNSNSTALVGAPIDYANETVHARKMEIPGASIMRGDVEIMPDYGVVLRSPDGTRYRIKVANGGALSTDAITTDVGLPLSDNFGAVNTQWQRDSFALAHPTSNVTIALASNQLALTLPDSTAGNNFAGYANGPHDLNDGGYERIHYISKPAAGNYRFGMAIGTGYRNNLSMHVEGSTISYVQTAGGSATTIASTTFNGATMVYWRLRRSSANVVAEYSTDGSAWTTLGTSTGAPFSFTKYRTIIEAGSTGSSTYSAPVVFDDYVYSRG